MSREKFRELLPIIQAYVDGKEIECYNGNGNWAPAINVQLLADGFEYSKYRVKPEPKYRPFNDEEMKLLVGNILFKKETGLPSLVTSAVENTSGSIIISVGNIYYSSKELLKDYTINKKPCGVLE